MVTPVTIGAWVGFVVSIFSGHDPHISLNVSLGASLVWLAYKFEKRCEKNANS